MKAEELMIGDWVFIKDYPIKALPQKVRPEHFVRSLVEFEPIPLTPEILEKNGFVLKEEEVGAYGVNIAPYYTRNDVPFEVFCDGEPFAIWFKDPVNIAFVHQLQHALRLCGIEKEIVL
jgi:hypothetical protein